MPDAAGASPEARVREALLDAMLCGPFDGTAARQKPMTTTATFLAPRVLAAIRAAARFGYMTEPLAPDDPFDGDDPDLLDAALAALAGEGEGT